MAVLNVVEGLLHALDRGMLTLAMFIDFSANLNSLVTSYILVIILGAGLSIESAM